MSKEQILRTQLRQLMAKTFNVRLDDLEDLPSPDTTKGWDSLAHMSLIEGLERHYNVEITHAESVELLDQNKILSFLIQRVDPGEGHDV